MQLHINTYNVENGVIRYVAILIILFLRTMYNQEVI